MVIQAKQRMVKTRKFFLEWELFLFFSFSFKISCNPMKQVKVQTKVVIGDPKEKICEAVDELHADLLVMGSRAFGPIKR